MNKERFPLTWPDGKARTKSPQRSPFRRPGYPWVGHSMSEAMDLIESNVRQMQGTNLIVSTNIKLRQDGLPYSGQAQPKDTGAAAYFTLKNKPISFSCDKYNRVECNLWSIGKTIEATRAIERWGSATIEQSFRGFMAIAEKTGGLDPYALLGVELDCTEDDLAAARNRLAKVYHPDIPITGSHAKWCEISDAYNLIAQNLRKPA
jgi:hypothetical protein